MASVTRWTYLGLALLVVGLLAAGVGAATHVDERRCELTQFVTVRPANASADEAVAYEDLLGSERAVFRAALDADRGVLAERGAIDETFVRYRNETYAVRVTRGSDCTPFHPTRVLAPGGGGLALVVVGALLTRGRGG